MSASAIYTGRVMHARWRPVRHRLRYEALYLLLDLDELPELSRRLRLFSTRGFNLFGFLERDHGDGGDRSLRLYVETHLRRAGIEPDGGPIRLLAMPRVLGTVFNPLSLFFCHRADGTLAAVLYEVNNTFGERHSYLIPATRDAGATADRVLRQSCAKCFYVSPFLDMPLTYHFRVAPPADRASVVVQTHDADGPILTAVFAGTRAPLTDANLCRAFLRHPLLAMQVLGAIHWEALKLWRKGLRVRPRPAPPDEAVSITLPADMNR
ncbi:MAG TPA: DUF1365 family protein [Methylomirabilota bacterium]|nr:DUF1365 family protein [Methylomirabilota bacterium]